MTKNENLGENEATRFQETKSSIACVISMATSIDYGSSLSSFVTKQSNIGNLAILG